MNKQLSYEDFRSAISIIDVAKHIGYSDKTAWAKEKRSKANPCLQNSAGDQIIISNPNALPGELYFNPQDSSDRGDLITFVMNKLNLDRKGINTFLSGFMNNRPLLTQTKSERNNIPEVNDKSFKAFYFKFSELNAQNLQFIYSRGIEAETLSSKVFQGVFKTVQIPVFKNGKFSSYSSEGYFSLPYREDIHGEITGVDYRNAEIQKHGLTSRKSTSVGLSNIPEIVDTLFIAESGVDAISHYQINKPGDNVLYVITGGNLTLGQLMTIENIKGQLTSNGDITTKLLFDNDVAGIIYDVKFIAHYINRNSEIDIFNIEQSKDSLIIEINTDKLPVKLCERLLSLERIGDNQISSTPGQIIINASKDIFNLQNLSHKILDLFEIKESVILEKSPVKKDWNDALQYNLKHNVAKKIYYHGSAYDLSNTRLAAEFKRGVGSNGFTLGSGIYLTDHLPAATLFSHLALKKRHYLEGKDMDDAGVGNLYRVAVNNSARILDASQLLNPDDVRKNILPGNTKFSNEQLSDFHFIVSVIPTQHETTLNPYQFVTTQLGYDGLLIEESTWKSWDYYPKNLNVHPDDFLQSPKTLIMYNEKMVEAPVAMNNSAAQEQILKSISNLISSFLDTIETRKEYEINKQLMYGTKENQIKAVSKSGNIITFKKPFKWKGISYSQIAITEDLKISESGKVKLIGFTRDSPWYENIDDLIQAVDWKTMEGFHNKLYKDIIKAPTNFSIKEISKDINELFGSMLSKEEAKLYLDQLSERFHTKLSSETRDLLAELKDFTNNTLADALKKTNTFFGETSAHYRVFEKQLQISSPNISFNNQAAKPEIFSQIKNKTMSQTNAGEQTQKTASEKMEGIMKSLGLKDVWDQLSKTFQSWADGTEEGRKSFVVENKTFRRTGFSDPSKNISTDMVVDISLNFNKNDKGVFFNSYTAELKNSIINGIKPEKRGSVKDTFDISLKKEESSNNLTIKKALNLLDGRSVCIGENNWIKRNGSDVVEYKFDLVKAIKENKHIDFSMTTAEHMESALESLKKGDYALISCAIDNKPVHVFLTADAQYKKIEANDNTLYRHLSEAEKTQIQENMNNKQEQVQGAKQHP